LLLLLLWWVWHHGEAQALLKAVATERKEIAKARGVAVGAIDDWDDQLVADDDGGSDDDPPNVGINKRKSPLTIAVDWNGFPSAALFAFGAGALLVKVKSLDKILQSITDCLDIDFALNIGTARGQTTMATLAEPVFSQNFSLAKATTIH